MKEYVILVAGGKGTRMKGDLPKQFLLLRGEPVLAHTLRRFKSKDRSLIVVMHPDFIDYWQTCAIQLQDIPEHSVIPGGNTRAQSVKNGLSGVPDDACVAIHDAVRPLCSRDLITQLFTIAKERGSAVPVIPCKDSLRRLTETGSETVPRDDFRAVQTPQVFYAKQLFKAYENPEFESYTDDASLVEAAGFPLELVAGEDTNLKLTVQADLTWAEAFLTELQESRKNH